MSTLDLEQKPFNIIVKLSNDYYKAFISVELIDPEAKPTKDDIMEALKDKKVVFGIDPNTVDFIVRNPEKVDMIEVANGIEHKHGIDSKITYKVDITADLKPKKNEDGTVDFKNMDYAQSVTKGQVLAVKTPITLGENGTTVTGMIIKAKDGKMNNFKFGKNVTVTDDEMSIVSAVDGTLKVEGYKLSVIEVLEIFSDVGVKTGNISFSGKVVIRGSITSGFKVETPDSIEVYGVVESAEVIAGGDITISGGVQGNDKCTIKATGNIKSNYFNNCNVIAGGDITTDSMMHCEVVCDGTITAKGRKGLIMGGSYTARHHIFAKTIGAEIGTITKLQLGITNEIMEEFQDLAEKMKDCKSNISKLNKAFVILKKQKQVKPDDLKIAEMYNSTNRSMTEYNAELKKITIEFKRVNDLIEQLKDVSVKAETLNVGVRIKIGNTHYNVKNAILMVKVIKERGEIIIQSY